MPWWGWTLVLTGTLLIGWLIGRFWSLAEERRWQMDAVEMARLNAALMDRMDALEAERQKEA
jgi:hypothetical protein